MPHENFHEPRAVDAALPRAGPALLRPKHFFSELARDRSQFGRACLFGGGLGDVMGRGHAVDGDVNLSAPRIVIS